MDRNRAYSIGVLVAVAALGIGVGIGYFAAREDRVAEERLADHGYRFVNPLLSCGDASPVLPGQVSAMREDVESYIAAQRSARNVSEVALYFRDLRNGPIFGINEFAEFSPGSLGKVPVLMAVLEEAERNPGLLGAAVVFGGGTALESQGIMPATPLVAGTAYTVEELLRRMITQSDNEASQLLYEVVGGKAVTRTYDDLGLLAPVDPYTYSMRVRDYASFFRLLFNATYLSPDASEYALALLSESMFKDGLVAGVPPGVTVAHKFGERTLGDGEQQLHDCGIVYAPDHPYILCVMTRGPSIEQLEQVVAGISRIVYERITAEYD